MACVNDNLVLFQSLLSNYGGWGTVEVGGLDYITYDQTVTYSSVFCAYASKMHIGLSPPLL